MAASAMAIVAMKIGIGVSFLIPNEASRDSRDTRLGTASE
jgi:hypothetical protein